MKVEKTKDAQFCKNSHSRKHNWRAARLKLGCALTETLAFTDMAELLLGSWFLKIQSSRLIPFNIYSKLYTACVTPILDYCA